MYAGRCWSRWCWSGLHGVAIGGGAGLHGVTGGALVGVMTAAGAAVPVFMVSRVEVAAVRWSDCQQLARVILSGSAAGREGGGVVMGCNWSPCTLQTCKSA